MNTSVKPSVAISATYCLMRLASGSVRMRRKSSRVSAFSSTRIGRRPCSSGRRSDGFATWNAPEAMNSTWSVFTGPYLVDTRGALDQRQEIALHAFARDLRARTRPSPREQILSISSRNTMPLFSTARMASLVICSLSISLSLSSAIRRSWLSCTVTRRGFVTRAAHRLAQHLAEVDGADCAARHAAAMSNIGKPLSAVRTRGSRFPCR